MSCLHNFQKIQPDYINIIVDGIPIFAHFCFDMCWNAQFGCSDISVDLKCTIYIFTKNLYKHFKLDLFYQYIFYSYILQLYIRGVSLKVFSLYHVGNIPYIKPNHKPTQ